MVLLTFASLNVLKISVLLFCRAANSLQSPDVFINVAFLVSFGKASKGCLVSLTVFSKLFIFSDWKLREEVKFMGRVIEINYTFSSMPFLKDFNKDFTSSQKWLLGNGFQFHTPINATYSTLNNSVFIACSIYTLYSLILLFIILLALKNFRES